MSTVTFDTLKLARKLESAGFTPDQAAGTAEAIAESSTDNLATKADIARLENQITELRGETKLNRWMLALVIAATVLPLIKGFM